MTLKEIERLLEIEIGNWVRWAQQRNYLPQLPGSVLGRLMVRDEDDKKDEMKFEYVAPPDEAEAEAFERAINALPKREREAFILHHLSRGKVGHITVRVKRRSDKAAVMRVGTRQYHYLVHDAHKRLLSKWQRE